MFRNLAEDISFLLIKNKIVEIEKREIYIYGLEVILLNGGLLITFLIISLLCGEMINFLAYLIFFLPMRLFSGGYHAETSERCFILSTIIQGQKGGVGEPLHSLLDDDAQGGDDRSHDASLDLPGRHIVQL